jgi:hypothetical protein
MRLIPTVIVAASVIALGARSARAQAGLPGPLVDVGVDGVATASAFAGGRTWSPRVTFNFTPDVALAIRALRLDDDRRPYRREATTIEADAHRQIAHVGPLAIQGLAGFGVRHRRDFTPRYALDPATGRFGPVSDHVDRNMVVGVFGAGAVQRLGAAVELRQDLRVAIQGDGIEMSLAAGVTVPLGRYVTRPGGQSVRIGRYRLRTGQQVWITQDDGTTIEGHVGDISPSSIEVLRASGRVVVDTSHASRIAIPDSIRNGARNGAWIGGLGLGIYTAILATSICECHDGTAVIVPMMFAGLGTGSGAVIGAIVDSFRVGQRTILERPAAATIAIAPILTPTRKAATVSVRW